MGALDRLRAANGDDGFVGRARSSPRLVVAIAGGAVLLLAWIGWAIYVTSDHGARAGLGVVIAWPAMLAALALISLPFIGGYLLIKRLSPSEQGTDTAEATASDADDQADEDSEEEESENSAEEEGSEDEDEESEDDDSDEDEEDDDSDGDEKSEDDDEESDEDENSDEDEDEVSEDDDEETSSPS